MNGKGKEILRRALAPVFCLALGLGLSACHAVEQLPDDAGEPVTDPLAAVYYLNPDAAHDAQWQELAALYSQQTGSRVKVVSVEPERYEETLASELSKMEAPTLFRLDSAGQLETWGAVCWDMRESKSYGDLEDAGLAPERDGAVPALPLSVSFYGLAVNAGLLDRLELDAGEIDSLEDLRRTAEAVSGIEDLDFAAFAAPGLSGASKTSQAALLANAALALSEGPGERLKELWQLTAENGTCAPSALAGRDAAQGLEDFTSGKAAFYLSGSWEGGAIREAMEDAELSVLPVYVGAGEEEDQGLSQGPAAYWCVNAEADLNDIEATEDFIDWCFRTEQGIAALKEMGCLPPYKAARLSETGDLFTVRALALLSEGRPLSPWRLYAGAEAVTAALAGYADGGPWAAVEAALPAGTSASQTES